MRALRPEQWIKNGVVFAPLVFGLRLLEPAAILASLAAFAVFCAASSAVYLWNDICDLERDRGHPRKALRPIAAGEISVGGAAAMAAGLAGAGLAGGYLVAPELALVTALYLAVNLAYSLRLKHVAIVDVLLVAFGFVLRAVAGGSAISVSVSPWLVVCTFMVMLFLALGKRRAELAELAAAGAHRPASRGYTLELLDQMMTVVVAATIVSYCLYTLSPEVRSSFGVTHLEMTVPFVVYGLFRYLQIVREGDRAENPSRALVTDRRILLTTLLWGGLVLLLLYAANGG